MILSTDHPHLLARLPDETKSFIRRLADSAVAYRDVYVVIPDRVEDKDYLILHGLPIQPAYLADNLHLDLVDVSPGLGVSRMVEAFTYRFRLFVPIAEALRLPRGPMSQLEISEWLCREVLHVR